jgi:glc operon protein GlcG
VTNKIVHHIIALTTLALVFTTRFAVASPLPTTPVLALEAAQTVIDAAEKTAQANGWPGVIAVVDAAGAGFVMMSGGIPLVADGQTVGAIGVSSDTPVHDEIIAKAGVAALRQ